MDDFGASRCHALNTQRSTPPALTAYGFYLGVFTGVPRLTLFFTSDTLAPFSEF